MSDKGKIPGIFEALKPHVGKILEDRELSSQQVNITCRTLTPEEALGNPDRDDFPLQKGKEKLMQAELGHYGGQAYTDRPGNIEGTVAEILNLPPINNFNRAAVVAVLNAILRSKNELERTIHCKNEDPGLCGNDLIKEITSHYGQPRVVMIGLQPAMAEKLSKVFDLRIIDLDPQNEGKKFNNTCVETGQYSIIELEKWCDLFLVTGSTIVNGTIDLFLDRAKPVIFFGTSIAGPAKLLGLEHFCPRST